jgi:hypothetical protein
MPVLFNSVDQFVEQVGRRRVHKRKSTELDSMDCIFTGPKNLVSSAIPLDGTPHPTYPMMTSTGWEVTEKEALYCELRISYTGKFQLGVPLISQSWHEGSISWSSYIGQVSKAISPGYTVPPQYGPTGMQITAGAVIPANTGIGYLTISYAARFTIEVISTTYLTQNPGTLTPKQLASVTHMTQWTTGAALSNNKFGTVVSTLEFENHVDETVTDLGNGWFEDTYVANILPVINSTVNVSNPPITA